MGSEKAHGVLTDRPTGLQPQFHGLAKRNQPNGFASNHGMPKANGKVKTWRSRLDPNSRPLEIPSLRQVRGGARSARC